MKRILVVMLFILTISLTSCTEVSYDITLNVGKDIVKKGETWVDAGCDISINEVLYEMELNNDVFSHIVGDIELLYTYEFESEVYLCHRIVKVLEEPIFNVQFGPSIDTIHVGTLYEVTDLVFPDSNQEDYYIEIHDYTNSNEVGVYEVNYIIIDKDGNQIK